MRAVNLLPADLRGAVKATAAVVARPGGRRRRGRVHRARRAGPVRARARGRTSSPPTRSSSARPISRRSIRAGRPCSPRPRGSSRTRTSRRSPPTRIATVRDLASQRFDWETALRDLSRALPERRERQAARRLGLQRGRRWRCHPRRDRRPRDRATGCTADQPAVAKMMSRLRAVGGVTRVSLASSTKSESETRRRCGRRAARRAARARARATPPTSASSSSSRTARAHPPIRALPRSPSPRPSGAGTTPTRHPAGVHGRRPTSSTPASAPSDRAATPTSSSAEAE